MAAAMVLRWVAGIGSITEATRLRKKPWAGPRTRSRRQFGEPATRPSSRSTSEREPAPVSTGVPAFGPPTRKSPVHHLPEPAHKRRRKHVMQAKESGETRTRAGDTTIFRQMLRTLGPAAKCLQTRGFFEHTEGRTVAQLACGCSLIRTRQGSRVLIDPLPRLERRRRRRLVGDLTLHRPWLAVVRPRTAKWRN